MIKYYEKNYGQNYKNFIVKFLQFIYDEWMILMVTLKLFDPVSMSFVWRRLVWSIAVMSLVSLLWIFGFSIVGLLAYIAIHLR